MKRFVTFIADKTIVTEIEVNTTACEEYRLKKAILNCDKIWVHANSDSVQLLDSQ